MLLAEEALLEHGGRVGHKVPLALLEPLVQKVHLGHLVPLVQQVEQAHLGHLVPLVQQALLEQGALEERVEWEDQ